MVKNVLVIGLLPRAENNWVNTVRASHSRVTQGGQVSKVGDMV